MPVPSVLYCNDEDIAIQASGDWPDIVPADQTLAYGKDGAISGGAPWVLDSASCNFQTSGLADGHVLTLIRLGTAAGYQRLDRNYVVSSVSGTSCTLRLKGEAAGFGQAPGPATGWTAVEFSVRTLMPQIRAAAADINQRYGIDDLIASRAANLLYDPTELRNLTVLGVLKEQYLAMSRHSGESSDDWSAKSQRYRSLFSELIARITLYWKDNGTGTASGLNPFSTRISR